MSRKTEYRKNKNIISGLSEKLVNEADLDRPVFVQRKLQGYNTAMVAFAGLGVIGAILTRSIPLFFLGLLLALIIAVLSHIQKKSFDKNGYMLWHFEVLEHTKLTRFNARPTGLYAESLDGPYEGKTCHLALSGQGVIPPEGRIIEVCVPGNTEANLINDVYYIPQYYGLDLVREAL